MMNSITLNANVQYNDYVGSISADNNDRRSITSELKEKLLINENEFVVGFEFMPIGLTLDETNEVLMYCYVVKNFNFEDFKREVDSGKPISVRKVSLELTLEEFFKLFKRLHAVFSWSGLLNNAKLMVEE